MEKTSETLLFKMRNPSDADWVRFYSIYQGPIVRYAQKLGLKATDANDVLQDTMITLMDKLPTFEYDPRRGKFRNFLLTIVHRKSLRAMRRHKRRQEQSIDGKEDRMRVENDLEDQDLKRWEMSLLETCIDKLRQDESLDEDTFPIFEAVAVHGRRAREVAEQFGTNENNVYQIKSRLVQRLRREVEKLRKAEDA